MAMAFGSFFSVLMLFFSPADEIPADALSLVRPDVGLEILGQPSGDDDLAAIIGAPSGEEETPPEVEVDPQTKSAIQNLASRTGALRDAAREELIARGPGILPRMRALVEDDPRRADEARKVIEAIEGKKVAARHEREIARQLAIRLAADRKLTKLVPAIRKALETENPFVRLAAADALARLDKTRRDPSGVKIPGGDFAELEALPSETRFALSARLPLAEPGSAGPITIHRYVETLRKNFPEGMSVDDSEIREACEYIVNWVRGYGNMRPDRVYLANVGGVGENGGGLAIFARGLYEPAVLRETLASSPIWTSTEVSGYTVYNSVFLRLVLLDDHSALILPVVASNHFPLPEYLASLKKGEKSLGKDKRWGRFLEGLRGEIPVRGFAITDETLMGEMIAEMRGDAPEAVVKAVESMQDLALEIADAGEETMRLRLEASFQSEEAAKDLADFLRAQIDTGIRELEQAMQDFQVPGMQPMLEIMKAIVVSAEGKQGILRFSAKRLKVEDLFGTVMGTAVQEVR